MTDWPFDHLLDRQSQMISLCLFSPCSRSAGKERNDRPIRSRKDANDDNDDNRLSNRLQDSIAVFLTRVFCASARATSQFRYGEVPIQ